MRMPVTLFMAIGKAALNVAGVGIVGDAAEIGKAAWNLWKKSPEERIEELEAVVGADDGEIARAVERSSRSWLRTSQRRCESSWRVS